VTDVNQLIIEHLDIWTSATQKKSSAGRGNGGAISLYGIKKLRELILELAVRGKLVPQDDIEESGGDLLRRIKGIQRQLYKSKSIKKPKDLPEPSYDELDYIAPSEWALARLNDLGDWGAGATPSRKSSGLYGGDIPWFKSGELTADLISTSEETVTAEALKKSSLRLNKPGDVLVAMYGATIGKTAILDVEATTNQAVCACTPFDGLHNRYLLLLLKAYKSRLVGMGAGGAQPNISREKIIATVVALPPTAEQYRIVAKVNELMGLCDALEAQAEDSLKAHQTLVETCLATLTNSQTPEVLTQNWTRIEAHFDTLFTTEESLDLLWKTTLNLAIRGDLVLQEPSDQPASELITDIRKTKEVLIAEGNLRKAKALSPIKEEEIPFPLKEGWVWVRLNDFIDVRDGTHDSPKDAIGSDTFPLVTSKNFKDGIIDFETARRISDQDHQEISRRSHVERDDILFSMIGGNLGNQVIVRTDEEFSIKNVALFKYYDKSKSLPEFIKLYMENLAIDLQKQASGGAQPFVSLGFLRNLLIAVPPLNEQQRIVRKARSIQELIMTTKNELSKSGATTRGLADTFTSKIH
jgi:type I restriction enzyme S subunit